MQTKSDNSPMPNSNSEAPNSILEISNIVNQIKPPPIFVKGVMCEAFIELIGVDNFYCKFSSDCLNI